MLALVEVDICRVTVFVLGDNGYPVCAVVELYFAKGIGGNFAVDIKSSVGEKSAELVLTALKVYLIIACFSNIDLDRKSVV